MLKLQSKNFYPGLLVCVPCVKLLKPYEKQNYKRFGP